MDALYHNPIITAILTVVALAIICNSGLQIYMLNGPPILIEKEIQHNGAAGYSLGPLIYLNPTEPATRYRVLRHEYQHYMQTAVLSPLGFAVCYGWQEFFNGYDNNWFELDAYDTEGDGLEFKVFDWNLKQILEVRPWAK